MLSIWRFSNIANSYFYLDDLSTSPGFMQQVKIDWDRYVDEDEEEEGFDTSAVSFRL